MHNLFNKINFFSSIAKSESLPPNSTNLKTILSNIESIDTFQAKKKYAEINLKHLSSGSSRLVYLSPSKTIIKIAKNPKGIAQNKAEANPKLKSPLLNKIISHSKDYSWIQTTFLNKLTEKEFQSQTNINFKDFAISIKYELQNISETSKAKPKNFDSISSSKFFKEISNVAKKSNLMPGDIARISSWGQLNNHPVLIDAGLTKPIFDEFYK